MPLKSYILHALIQDILTVCAHDFVWGMWCQKSNFHFDIQSSLMNILLSCSFESLSGEFQLIKVSSGTAPSTEQLREDLK